MTDYRQFNAAVRDAHHFRARCVPLLHAMLRSKNGKLLAGGVDAYTRDLTHSCRLTNMTLIQIDAETLTH